VLLALSFENGMKKIYHRFCEAILESLHRVRYVISLIVIVELELAASPFKFIAIGFLIVLVLDII
jgi:hypothetical protein